MSSDMWKWTSGLRVTLTKNVVSPLVWLTAIVTPLCLILAERTEGPKVIAFLVFAAAPITLLAWAYRHFAISDPKLLLSEETQTKQAVLATFGQRNRDGRIDVEMMRAISGGPSAREAEANIFLTAAPDVGKGQSNG